MTALNDWTRRRLGTALMLILVQLVIPAAAEDKPTDTRSTHPTQKRPVAKPSRVGGLPTDARIERDIVYGKDHERQKLDLYRPASQKVPVGEGTPDGSVTSDKSTRLPVIVWVHGGAWLAGSKANPPSLAMVGRGYAVASINYRLSQHAVYPAQLHDCKAAIRFLRANADTFGLDPERIGVWGGSAGGHLVALLGTTGDVPELEGSVGDYPGVSSKVACVCDWFGPTDLARIHANTSGQVLLGKFDTPEHPVYKLLGGTIADKKDLAEKANPLAFATAGDAPFLIVHGDRDPLVPLAQSELLAEALKKVGVPCELVVIKNGGHGGSAFFAPDVIQKHMDFFDRHLKP